ncbi:Ig-like domain-containing protein [bacterium]|nr:Ig-like domain-containing protein [bacterium]
MKKYLLVLTVLTLVLAAGLFIGCADDPLGNQAPVEGVSQIELRVTHTTVKGFDGEQRSETITAIARNANGVAVSGEYIEFAINDPAIYKGTIVENDSVTNYEGKSTATFSVIIERTTSVTIVAKVGSITASKVIQINKIDDVIGDISVSARSVLSVKPNETATTAVTATVVDTSGMGISDILVSFRVSPPNIGSVDSDTGTTNVNGQVFKTFSSTGANPGECKIYARVGPNVDSTSIEVKPIDEPYAIQVYTGTPNLKVVPDQNAQIEVTATVTDQNGNGVPATKIIFQIRPYSTGAYTFGSLTPVDTTNEFGIATTTFNTLGKFGKVFIRADVNVGSDQYSIPIETLDPKKKSSIGIDGFDSETILPDSLLLNVELLTNEISVLSLAVNPNYLLLPKDTVGTAMVYGRVIDQDNNGIPNMRVNFNCQFGTLANTTLTDSTGRASAEYYILPITDFPTDENGEIFNEISDNIRAVIPNTAFVKYTSVTVEKTASDEGTISLSSDVDFIYADFGLTTAKLQAVLKDANNQALAGREVIFTATHGTVNSPVVTDSMGVARATFTDNGIPSTNEHGDVIPSVITTVYNPMSLAASLEITIRERNPVSDIALHSQEDQLTAGSGDSTWVGAICFVSDGGFAPEGTIVYFECDRGRFVEPSVPITGHNGTAINYYIADPVVGKAHLTAHVDNGDTLVYSNMVEIELIAGPPTRIGVRSDPPELNTTEPTVFSTITATVRDTANNHVSEGYLVTFTATLGALDRVSASTDENGQASVQLRPGVNSGVSVITATVNTVAGEITGTTTVDIVAGEGNSIELGAYPNNIAVAGTGVNSSSTLTASLYDPNHNLVQTAHWIIFEILYEPAYIDGGCHFRNRAQRDSAQTSNGRASVTLNAGTVIGGKLLKAYAVFGEDREDTVSVILSRVSVTAGPPEYIAVDFNEEGTEGEGGVWICEVSARVFDVYMNPVSDSIPVVFSCDSVAQIGAGFTGNESDGGQVTPGVAYAQMSYNSENTFDTLTIVAEVNSPNGIKTGSRKAALPLQSGVMVLQVDPQNWMIDFDPEAVFTVWVELRDGHGVLINNAPVLFNSSRAHFWWYDYRPGRTRFVIYDYLSVPPEPVRKFTGWNLPDHPEHRERRGQATVYLRGEMADFFLDPVTPEVNVQIGALVEGYDDVIADPVIVVITRHP